MKITRYMVAAACLVTAVRANGQAIHPNDYHSNVVAVTAPGAAEFKTRNEIPVNYFTGTPSIDIPLTSLSNGKINVPVSLAYTGSSGIKVSDMPGLAGLGWDLVCGGSISRKVNGFPDEYNNANPNFNQSGYVTDKGYFFQGQQLDYPHWNTTPFIRAHLDAFRVLGFGILQGINMDFEPDEFQFNFGGYSGSFYRTEKNEWKVKSKQHLMLEISHEIATNNTYRLSTRFNALVDTDEEVANASSSEVASLFTKFTIVTPDGFRYEFGGDSAAIEFSRGPKAGNLQNLVEHEANYITANTWRLTRITAPDGAFVRFSYRHGRALFQKSKYYIPGFADGTTHYQSPVQRMTVTAISPSYLTAVETPLTRVDFVTSRSVELGPSGYQDITDQPAQVFKQQITANYNDLLYAYNANGSTLTLASFTHQLDSIKVFDKTAGRYTNGYRLCHSAHAATRRTLDSIQAFAFSGDAPELKFSFEYNNVTDLPGYESLRRDHYGYFNGSQEPPLGSSMLPGRTPSSFALYGMIRKITYPEGGTAEFEFEPGGYAKAMQFDGSNTVSPVSLIDEAGTAGVRIKKISYKANYGAPAVGREFYYRNNFATGGTSSSGILGMKMPVSTEGYLDQITYNIDWGPSSNCSGLYNASNFSDNNSEWLGMLRGGIVTYSEVAEQHSDGSFSVYHYANHDQEQYRDELHDNFAYSETDGLGNPVMSITHSKNFRVTANDLERGNLLSAAQYTSQARKVKETIYTYRNEPGRKNQFIKAISHKELYSTKQCGGNYFPPASAPRGWAYRIYCYSNPVKTIEDRLYDSTGSWTRSSVDYTYDEYGNVLSSTSRNSDGKALITSTKYNSHGDFLGNTSTAEAINLKRLFVDFRIKNLPVEKLSMVAPAGNITGATKITGGQLFRYIDPSDPNSMLALEITEPFVPFDPVGPTTYFNHAQTVNGAFTFDSRYKPQYEVLGLSNYPPGNLRKALTTLAAHKRKAYTWDYGMEHVSSTTDNAENPEVAFTSFEGNQYSAMGVTDDRRGNWSFNRNKIVAGGYTGNRHLHYDAGNETMMESQYALQPGKTYELSFRFRGWMPAILNGNAAIGISSTGQPEWTYYATTVTGNGGFLSLKSLPLVGIYSFELDEVRLYPVSSQMTSYTYDPPTGKLLSETDPSGRTVFYRYDGLNRLTEVKDQQGKVLRKYAYSLAGQ